MKNLFLIFTLAVTLSLANSKYVKGPCNTACDAVKISNFTIDKVKSSLRKK